MLKIALIGAPTSGKTELAQQLSHSLSDRNLILHDDYIAEVEKRGDVVLGHYASYLGNIQAAIGRFETERNKRNGFDVSITCGTLVENAVYTAILAYVSNKSSGMDTGFKVANDTRANLTMTLLGILRHDLWDYDLTFYLPLEDKADRWNEVVDDHIPECAETLGVEYIKLPEARADRLQIALEEIEKYEATLSNGQTIRNSKEESQDIGNKS